MTILETAHKYPIRMGIVIGLFVSIILNLTGVW